MNISIISIDHYLQYLESKDDSDSLRSLKERLRVLLRQRFEAGPIAAICEESSPVRATIAQEMARNSKPPVSWHDIHMSTQERTEAGIFEALRNRPGCPDSPDMSTWIEFRIPADEIREDYFVRRIEALPGTDQTVLVLLGDMHVAAVAKTLAARGHRVEYTQELIPKKRWSELNE